MADSSTKSITIDAAPGDIMAVIADFDAYPQWAGYVKKTEVIEEGPDGRAKRVRFTLDAGVLKDDYELEYNWAGDASVTWTLLKSKVQRSQLGKYTLRPTGGATEVTYDLAIDLSIPMIGLMKRKAEKMIMDTALKELKKRVEAGN